MIKVFISGPYTLGDVALNIKNAMTAANEIINMGAAPYCPHLSHFLHMNNYQEYSTWLEIDNEFLLCCDIVLRLPGISNGADKEVELAKTANLPVIYHISELEKYL